MRVTLRSDSWFTRSLSAALLTGSVLVAAAAPAAAQAPMLEGTWWVRIAPLTACTGGTPTTPFWSLLTFAGGGTLTGTTMNQAFAPGQRGPDHGTWVKADGPFGYTASSAAFLNFTTAPGPGSPGFQAGFQRIDQVIALTRPDAFSSTAVVSFYDTTVTRYRQACAVAEGYRFQ